MRGFVLSQLRRGGGRLVAAGIAIALGSAFVAAALLGSTIVKTTAYNSVSASFAKADLVVEPGPDADGPLTAAQLDALTATSGVGAVSPVKSLSFIVTSGAHSDYAWATTAATDSRLEPATPTDGRLPASADEIAITAETAKRLGVRIGSDVVIESRAADEVVYDENGDPVLDAPEPLAITVTVVGTLVDPAGFNYDSPTAILVDELATEVAQSQGYTLDSYRALVLLEDRGGVERVRDAFRADPALATMHVTTVEEKAHEAVVQFSGDTDILTGFVLTFAGIALVVAAIVISNTFQVLVAQRAHLLALLRCVGATRRQVRRSVLLEASVVGVVASTVGLALGALLAQVALWIVPALDLAVPVPTTIVLTPAVVAWPIITGTVVTVLAALTPARLATRVAPLAALRPVELTPVRKSGATRLVFALLGLIVGGGILGAATVLAVAAEAQDPTMFVLAGIFGGAVSFTGILIGAVYFVPALARGLGRLAARFGGVPGKIAAANSVRNPRRTTATASALLIGATLVTMMATGAATARGSLTVLLNEGYPIDIAVTAPWSASTSTSALTPAQITAVQQTDGVQGIARIEAITVEATLGEDAFSDTVVQTASPAELDQVVRSEVKPLPAVGHVAVPRWLGAQDGDTVTVTLDGTSVDLIAQQGTGFSMWLSEEDFAALGGDAVTTAVWLAIESGANPLDVATSLRDTFSELSATIGDPPPEIQGAAVERAGYEEVIDTMLAIIVGLLGVAVIIALVGVANTLSLSVLERRRESATLRAIGLRRGQLRQMLAIEGVIIALVGAVLGAALGLTYGWLGSTLLLAASGGLQLVVPWRDLGLVLAVAVAAGLLASVLPSRTATRTPPVAALTVD